MTLALLLGSRPAWEAEPAPFLALALAMAALQMAALGAWMHARGAGWTRLILTAAVAARLLILLLHPQDLSPDVYRYAWDGHLAVQGINPLRHAPDAAELIPLRTEFFTRINYRELPTIYPPTAQWLFAAAAVFTSGPAGVRVLLLLCDVGLLLLLAAWLRRLGLPEGRLLVYAWSPLPLVEVASSGHLEPLGALLLVGALILSQGPRRLASGAAWGGAVLAKFAPLVLAPVLLRRIGLRGLLGAGLAALLLWLPFLPEGGRLLESLGAYGSRWQAHEFLFSGLTALARGLGLEGPGSLHGAPGAARLAAMGLVGGYALFRGWRPGPGAPAADAARIMVLALLLAPTVHPWYLLWVLPLLCLVPSPAWILLSSTILLTYLHAGPGPAGIDLDVWAAWAPPLALAAWSGIRGRGLLGVASERHADGVAR